MKNPEFRKNHTKKEKTTNYPKDKHSDFCKRCYKFNRGCPQNDTCKYNL